MAALPAGALRATLTLALLLGPLASASAALHPGEDLLSSQGEWRGLSAPAGDWLHPAGGTPLESGSQWLEAELARRGLPPLKDSYRLHRQGKDLAGRHHLVFDQVFEGLPLIGQSLQLHFDRAERLVAVNGSIRALDPRLSLEAKIDLDEALQRALEADPHWQPQLLDGSLALHAPQWLGEAPGPQRLVWKLELVDHEAGRERIVLVDAGHGEVRDAWSTRHALRQREIYDGMGGGSLPGSLARSEGNPSVGDADIDAAYDYYGDTYDYFQRAFGRDSIDDEGQVMVATAHSTAPSCPNAFWSSVLQQMVFCNGTVTDDVVAHELTHGITSNTARLIYQNQSGQLNESFSDVFGELIDLYNGDVSQPGPQGGIPWPAHGTGSGTDTPNSLRSSCGDGVRWLIAEDAAAFGGAIRDMWQPDCEGHPDYANSPLQTCPSGDSGGVHSGSGVPNHAFAMLVDGKSYNGESVNGIGAIKAGAIWYQCLNWYLSPAADFEDAYHAFQLAGAALLGVDLNDPRTGLPSGEVLAPADLAELEKALRAVEMNTPGACGASDDLLLAEGPGPCGTGTLLYTEDFESGAPGWSATQSTMPTPYSWFLRDTLPLGRAGTAAFCENRAVGDCGAQDETGTHSFISDWITLEAEAAGHQLEFWHYFSMEAGWDGNLLRLERPDGSLWTPQPFDYLFNPPVGPLNPGNPLAGEAGFTGTSSKWGRSLLDLAAFDGDSLRLHFVLAKDGCTGYDGWYVDDLRLVSCGDCDTDGTLDHAELRTARVSPILPVPDPGAPEVWNAGFLPPAEGPVRITLTTRGDFSSASESMDVAIEGTPVGSLFADGGSDCPGGANRRSLTVDAALFNSLRAEGNTSLSFASTPEVNESLCAVANYLVCSLYYEHDSADGNGNGLPDGCELQLSIDYDGTTLLLDWESSPLAAEYAIFVRDAQGVETLLDTITNTHYEITGRLADPSGGNQHERFRVAIVN